jgi:hypothetical protein
MEVKEFLEQETGDKLGVGLEFSFDELGVSEQSLNKRVGKVGFKTRLTEYFQAAKSRSAARNPIAPNQADIVKWVLYDRFIFAAGTTVPNNFKFFTQPIGTAGKTKVDTNLDQVQRLPDPLWYNTEGVGFYFSNKTNVTDIQAFMDSEYMEFWVGQKVYLEGPIQVFPGGAGIFGNLAATLTAPAAFQIASNGLPRSDNVFDVRLPAGIHLGVDATNVPIITDGLIGITILQGQQFKIEMYAPLGGAALSAATPTATQPFAGGGLTIMAYLYGILSRGVQ